MSATPVLAATNIGTSNNSFKSTITMKPDVNSWGPDGGPSAEEIIDEGGVLQIGDEGKVVHEIQEVLINKVLSIRELKIT